MNRSRDIEQMIITQGGDNEAESRRVTLNIVGGEMQSNIHQYMCIKSIY